MIAVFCTDLSNLCCVGHITLDKVATPKSTVHMPGGTSCYFSHAIKHFDDIDYTLVTALAQSEMNVVDKLRSEGIDVTVMPSQHSVYFENIYGENQGYLYQRAIGAGIEEAGRFAAAMSTLKIEGSGPFSGSKEDIIHCMETAEQKMPEIVSHS